MKILYYITKYFLLKTLLSLIVFYNYSICISAFGGVKVCTAHSVYLKTVIIIIKFN